MCCLRSPDRKNARASGAANSPEEDSVSARRGFQAARRALYTERWRHQERGSQGRSLGRRRIRPGCGQAHHRMAAAAAVSARALESQSRTAIFIALALGGTALITAFVAVALALMH